MFWFPISVKTDSKRTERTYVTIQVQVGYIIKMSLKREYLDIRSCLHDIRLRI